MDHQFSNKKINKTKSTEKESLKKAFLQGGESYNEITQRNNEILSNFIKSNPIDSSITTTLANLRNSSIKSQFSLIHLIGNRFSFKKPNPQNVFEEGSALTFDNASRCDLNIYDLSYFLSNTNFDKHNFTEKDLVLNFCKDLFHNTNNGDKKSNRSKLILFLGSIRDVEVKVLEIV